MIIKITHLKGVAKLSTIHLKSIQGGGEDYNFCSDDLEHMRADCHRYVDQPGTPFLGPFLG